MRQLIKVILYFIYVNIGLYLTGTLLINLPFFEAAWYKAWSVPLSCEYLYSGLGEHTPESLVAKD